MRQHPESLARRFGVFLCGRRAVGALADGAVLFGARSVRRRQDARLRRRERITEGLLSRCGQVYRTAWRFGQNMPRTSGQPDTDFGMKRACQRHATGGAAGMEARLRIEAAGAMSDRKRGLRAAGQGDRMAQQLFGLLEAARLDRAADGGRADGAAADLARANAA